MVKVAEVIEGDVRDMEEVVATVGVVEEDTRAIDSKKRQIFRLVKEGLKDEDVVNDDVAEKNGKVVVSLVAVVLLNGKKVGINVGIRAKVQDV